MNTEVSNNNQNDGQLLAWPPSSYLSSIAQALKRASGKLEERARSSRPSSLRLRVPPAKSDHRTPKGLMFHEAQPLGVPFKLSTGLRVHLRAGKGLILLPCKLCRETAARAHRSYDQSRQPPRGGNAAPPPPDRGRWGAGLGPPPPNGGFLNRKRGEWTAGPKD